MDTENVKFSDNPAWVRLLDVLAYRGFRVSRELDDTFGLLSMPGYPDTALFLEPQSSPADFLVELQKLGFVRDLTPTDFDQE